MTDDGKSAWPDKWPQNTTITSTAGRTEATLMIERGIGERFCVYWWDEEGTDWVQQLALLLGWPVALETWNIEDWDGGNA